MVASLLGYSFFEREALPALEDRRWVQKTYLSNIERNSEITDLPFKRPKIFNVKKNHIFAYIFR